MTDTTELRELLAKATADSITWRESVPVEYAVSNVSRTLDELREDWEDCPDSIVWKLLLLIKQKDVIYSAAPALLDEIRELRNLVSEQADILAGDKVAFAKLMLENESLRARAEHVHTCNCAVMPALLAENESLLLACTNYREMLGLDEKP